MLVSRLRRASTNATTQTIAAVTASGSAHVASYCTTRPASGTEKYTASRASSLPRFIDANLRSSPSAASP